MQDIQKKLDTAIARKLMWEDVMRHEGWKELVHYLEGRYREIGAMECDSLRKLSERNARLSEIKKLFTYIHHDFSMEKNLAREFEQIVSNNDELPDPFNPFASS